MKYMLLIYNDADAALDPESAEGQARRAEWMDVTRQMGEDRVDGAALHPVETATTVRAAAPRADPVLTDGPYAETKEMLAGYYVVDVPDLDAAVSYAASLPMHPHGAVEVRPVVEIPGL